MDKTTRATATEDGQPRLIVPISQLRGWKDNPRSIDARELERVKAQLQELGQYKPLIAFQDEDGALVVLGGNQRLRAMQEMGWADAWISIVEARTEAERLKYALSDNDQAGRTDEGRLAALASRTAGIDLQAYRIHLAAPSPIKLDQAPAFTPAGSGPGQGEGEDGRPASATPTPGQAEDRAAELAGRILEETEAQDDGPDPEALIQTVTALIRTLAAETPNRLKGAVALITSPSRGRDFLLLVDPGTRDAITELRRSADAGSQSPIEDLFRKAIRLDAGGRG